MRDWPGGEAQPLVLEIPPLQPRSGVWVVVVLVERTPWASASCRVSCACLVDNDPGIDITPMQLHFMRRTGGNPWGASEFMEFNLGTVVICRTNHRGRKRRTRIWIQRDLR